MNDLVHVAGAKVHCQSLNLAWHQLRLEGRVQLSLLFRGQGQQVAMVHSQLQEVILTKMLQKTYKRG